MLYYTEGTFFSTIRPQKTIPTQFEKAHTPLPHQHLSLFFLHNSPFFLTFVHKLTTNSTFASSLFLNAEAQREKEYKKISVTLR